VTQRGEADVKAAMRAQGSRDRSNLLRRCQSGDRGVGCASVPKDTSSGNKGTTRAENRERKSSPRRVDEPDCGTRAAMAQDLVDRRIFVGRTRTRVKAILGSPDVTDGRTWTYELTPRIGSSLPDFLDVHFGVRDRVSSSRTALAGAP
jgi:hypothetical protein